MRSWRQTPHQQAAAAEDAVQCWEVTLADRRAAIATLQARRCELEEELALQPECEALLVEQVRDATGRHAKAAAAAAAAAALAARPASDPAGNVSADLIGRIVNLPPEHFCKICGSGWVFRQGLPSKVLVLLQQAQSAGRRRGATTSWKLRQPMEKMPSSKPVSTRTSRHRPMANMRSSTLGAHCSPQHSVQWRPGQINGTARIDAQIQWAAMYSPTPITTPTSLANPVRLRTAIAAPDVSAPIATTTVILDPKPRNPQRRLPGSSCR